MITETITYSLNCDDEACNNYFDGEDMQSESDVITEAESEGWIVIGQETFCELHRPGVEVEEIE